MARPEPSTLALREARAYIFRVLLSGQPRNFDDVDGMQGGLFILPRHPVSVQYQASPRTFVYATGIHEMRADQQGVDPPLITIGYDFGERGGYDPKSKRGLDGRRATRALEDLIRAYLKAAAERGRNRQDIHVLEFHDIYRGGSWVVAPQNVPYGAEDAARPYAESGVIRLQALRPADHAIPPVNPLPARLRDKHAACPLNPGCKYGGPFAPGCPYRSSQ